VKTKIASESDRTTLKIEKGTKYICLFLSVLPIIPLAQGKIYFGKYYFGEWIVRETAPTEYWMAWGVIAFFCYATWLLRHVLIREIKKS
jgi:hypothetical protein